jgi:hypothetical protein
VTFSLAAAAGGGDDANTKDIARKSFGDTNMMFFKIQKREILKNIV